MELSLLKLPESPAIFLDYISNFSKVKSFFQHNFRDDWPAVIESRSNFDIPRKAIVEILQTQNKQWDAPKATFANIQKLADKNTFAIVTGQQAGTLGGPLYTMFKTMTVLRLSEQLNRDFPQYNFVPVFWMEVNDSDFEEIASIKYINKENQIKQLAITETEADRQKPIAARYLDDQMQQWRQEVEDDFFDTEFKEKTLSLFFDCYASGHSLADAFARLLLNLFGNRGLIVLNPAGPDVCALAAPLFKKTLSNPTEIIDKFTERGEALKTAGYTAQIRFNEQQTLLFFNDTEMRRVRIDIDTEGQFRLKYPDGYKPIDRESLLKTCSERPEYLSPNVALRPLLQDNLLPTVAYVAGPSEAAYYAQIEVLYRYFQIPMPVIFPRHRVTLVEKKAEKIIQKNNLDYISLLSNRADFIETFIRENASQNLFNSLETTEKQIKDALENLRNLIKENDSTLLNPLDKTRQNIEGSFGKLSNKVTRSLEEKNKILVNQLERVLQNLLPGNNFQERELNFIYFAIKYGTGLLDEIYETLPENTDEHVVIKL